MVVSWASEGAVLTRTTLARAAGRRHRENPSSVVGGPLKVPRVARRLRPGSRQAWPPARLEPCAPSSSPPRRTRGAGLERGPRPRGRPRRGARRRRRDRGQPRRPAAAPGLLPATDGRPACARAGVQRPVLATSARASTAGRSATRCAPCCPAAATPSGSPYRRARCMPVPAGVDLVTAAALPEVACTVWSNVFMLAGLRRGETLLVHGGASGHRHHGDPARAGAGCPGGGHRRLGGQARPLPRARRGVLVNYRDEDFVERGARSHRRARRRRRARQHGREVPRPQRRRPRRRTGGSWSSACRAARRAELDLGRAHAQAGRRARDHAARPTARGEGRDRRVGAATTSGPEVEPAGSARSSTGCCR